MAIGVGKSSVTLEDILKRVTEADIVSYYFGISEIPCVINSPLREDKNPSFGFHTSDGRRIHWIDYSTNERGGVFDLLMRVMNCSYTECLEDVYNRMVKGREVKVTATRCNMHITHEYNSDIKLECKVRDWKDYDIAYWKSYGITLKWLKWAEVYPISHKIIIKHGKRNLFGAAKLAYAFVEHKDNNTTIKIYQPLCKEYKWANGHNGSVISLWSKIPKTGDKLIICSSLKDALCVSCQLFIPTLAVQGEGYDMSDTAINNLKSRYNKIYVSFDTDTPGILNTKRLAERTGFIPIIPDLGKCKDYSDYYKSLIDKQEFQRLKELFI